MSSIRPLGSLKRPSVRISGLLLVLALSLTSHAQLEPCGIYESDLQPGYTAGDLAVVAALWPAVGSYPDVPDYNGDGLFNVLDLAVQANCLNYLAPGLVGRYYGFNTGEPGQTMTFPDFSGIAFPPTVVKTTHQIEEFTGWDGFLNSDMLDLFAASYSGYLWVPEDANYTLEISGREGMRVRLDGTEILAYDGFPRTDSTTLALNYGLHPIEVELYVLSNGTATLTWSSDGTIVGAANETIGPDYLLHETVAPPEHAVTDLEMVFDPPSGSRTFTDTPRIQGYVVGPHGDVGLSMHGFKVLIDGKLDSTFNITLGLNAIPYTATDGAGRSVSGEYWVYYDALPGLQDGLSANIYVDEWYEGVVPPTEDMDPTDWFVVHGTQLQVDGNDRLYMNGRYIGSQHIVELNGVINIEQSGNYQFRIADGDGALFINGIQLAAIGNDFAQQWDDRGEIYLSGGKHNYRLRTGRVWESPRMRVFWTPPSGTESQVPPEVFEWSQRQRTLPPTFEDAQSTGSREAADQVAEYVFASGAPFADSSGHGYHLPHDPNAIPRAGGGVTYQSAGGMGNRDAGEQLVQALKDGEPVSLEVDFIFDSIPDYHERNLISLSAPWTRLMALYTANDDLHFSLHDEDGNEVTISGLNTLVRGNRYHVVGTFNGVVMKLYVNGVQVAQQSNSPVLAHWQGSVDLDIGQSWFRRDYPNTWGYQMHGTFLVAAAYKRELGPPSVAANMAANAVVTPTPGVLSHDPAPTFPPVGSSQADLDEAYHLLNRMAFGASPESLTEVITQGPGNWIAEQLDPGSIDDSAMETALASGYFKPTRYRRDLQGWLTYRMACSERQLQEVMTQFWENHFNTQTDKTSDLEAEFAENQRFRDLALGDFEQLLMASAMGYPMTVYLDNNTNVVGAANENYAREILELHTFGVNNGYTQEDIEELARCFTGWTVRDGDFYFNPGLHDYGAKSLLGLTIAAGGGLSDALTVIEQLASSPNTAAFLSFKLCQLFVADDPPADIQTAVAGAYNSSGGDVGAMLTALFDHARFRSDTAYRNNKTKTPLEFGVSLLRAAEIAPSNNSLPVYLSAAGMDLFNYADPTGFDEAGVAWIDTNALLGRWNMVNDFTTNRINQAAPSINLQALYQRYGWTGYVDILDFFENITTHGSQPAGARAIMESWLTDDNPGGFTIDDDSLDTRIRQTLGLYLRLPEFNKQ